MNIANSFVKLTPEECERLVAAGEVRSFKTGSAVIVEGQTVHDLLIVKLGNLRVTRTYLDNLAAEFAGPLGPGEVIGEMSFVDGKGASASLIADGDTEILAISRAEVDRLTQEDSGFAGRFYESLFLDLARKLRSTNQRVLPVAP